MADLRQELLSIQNEAAEYFVHVDTSYKESDPYYSRDGYYHGNGLISKDLWACMTPEDRSRGEAILAKFGAVIEEGSRGFQRSPALGETSLSDLQQALRQMRAAFQFKEWEGSAEFWRDLSPSDAKLIIEKALVTIRGLLSFGLSPE
jgi:hypothetical protein